MSNVTLCVHGKLKRDFAYLKDGEAEYLKRLKAFASVELLELADETITATCPPEVALQREAERLQPYLNNASLVVALSERGDHWSSPQLAQQLAKWQIQAGEGPLSPGASPPSAPNAPSKGGKSGRRGGILLIVGSAHGLAPSVLQQAHVVWSLSKLTLPHPMVRLVVLEQLYRAFTIQKNLPYHK